MKPFVLTKSNGHDDNSDDESGGPTQSPGMPDIARLLQNASKQGVFREHNHIYFRCTVTMKTVNTLCNMIEEYNREHDVACATITTSLVIPKPLYLHITSGGGSVHAGFLAYDYIRNSKIPIYTIAEAVSASSAANMFMAGHRRFMTKYSYLLIHQIRQISAEGSTATFSEVKDNTVNSIELMSRIIDIYLNNIRHNCQDVLPIDILTKEKLEDIMSHDIFWNYDICKKYGLVDDIYTNYNDRDVVDSNQFLRNDLREISTIKHNDQLDSEDCKPSVKTINRIAEFAKTQANILDIIKQHMAKNPQGGGDDIQDILDEDSELNKTDNDTGCAKKLSSTHSKRKKTTKSQKGKRSMCIDDRSQYDLSTSKRHRSF
jgi:ATP-dependent protease ClpP protease subunit